MLRLKFSAPQSHLRLSIACWLALVSVAAAAAENVPEAAAGRRIDFNADIRPIFIAHCTACHGGVKQAADISFAYREQVLASDGWIVQPGDPDASTLIDRVLSDDPEVCMPPRDHGPRLSDDDIERLTRWIAQGADWREHWAFETPRAAPIPAVEASDWPLGPIDHFVLHRLVAAGLTPSPDAPADRWLRRVTLDLTGLPPTPGDRQSFLDDVQSRGEAAYAAVVDRLLDSPAFGERWASVWLDQIRYADSKGLGLDGPRNIWKYRDWVIDSLNQDLPYDQFTIKQIAGDLLPDATIDDHVATAAHRVTQSNEEGGTDDEEFRVAAVLDRVSTTWQTWQGMTFGCVQCHSHPYDPFGHEEFYEFAAFFNNTADSDLNQDWPAIEAPIDPRDHAEAERLDRQIGGLRQSIFDRQFALLTDSGVWQPLTGLCAETSNATRLSTQTVGDHEEFHTVGTVTQGADFTLTADVPPSISPITAIGLTALPLDPAAAIADTEWGFVLSGIRVRMLVEGQEPIEITIDRVIGDEMLPHLDPNETLNAKSSDGFAAYTRIHHPRRAALIPSSPVDVPESARLEVTLKHRVFMLSAFPLIIKRGHLSVSDDDRFTQLLTDERLTGQRDQLASAEARRAKIESTAVPVLRERPRHLARPQHVFNRGLFLTKDQRVSPDTPESMPPMADTPSPDRLTMARWMVAADNPLTARVAVNRIWARLFGTGIVASEEDFGSSGDPPTHPELLDYLAVEYQSTYGWSTKRLIRQVVLSRTYRQSSKTAREANLKDPDNRLLARGPRHRLSAEIVRDQALSLAGLLSDERFGPPVRPPIPEGVWRPFYSGDLWENPAIGDRDRYRRSIYTYTKRSIPYPMFAAFDAPSREFCTPRRLRSNTPLQALMTLNDETFRECAAGLAQRMRAASDDPAQQITFGLQTVTLRDAADAEVDELLKLLDSIQSDEDHQPLTTVATVLLNLDEVLTK